MSFVNLKKYLLKNKDNAEVEKSIPKVLVENIIEPRFNLNVANMQVTKIKSELLKNLDLSLRGNFLFVVKDRSFSEELLYDSSLEKDFREYIIKHGGYLIQEKNYFEISPDLLSELTRATMLINSRVLLFWRGITIDDLTVKKILTAGLGFLIGSISYPELLLLIKKEIPNETFEVSVKYQTNAYVMIGIEEPVFSR